MRDLTSSHQLLAHRHGAHLVEPAPYWPMPLENIDPISLNPNAMRVS
jgi:hypothetical protein